MVETFHLVLCMKPLDGTYAQNVLSHGVAGLNIDGCRVVTDEVITNHSRSAEAAISKGKYGDSAAQETHQTTGQTIGRWPANVILDGNEEVVRGFPQSSVTGKRTKKSKSAKVKETTWLSNNHKFVEHTDSGSTARFFWNFGENNGS